MATITSNGTGGGDWSATATWTGAVVPVDGDMVIIDAGDTVDYDVDTPLTNGVGIEIRGTLQPKTGGDRVLRVIEYNNGGATGGCIVNDQRAGSGGTVGKFLVGTDLDNGFATGSSFEVQMNAAATNVQLFKQTENPDTNGNWLQCRVYDEFGHVQRHGLVSAYDAGTDTATCDFDFPNAAVGDTMVISASKNRGAEVTLDSGGVSVNGSAWDVDLTTVNATTEGTIASKLTQGTSPVVLWLESNVRFVNHIASTTAQFTTSLVNGVFCAKYDSWARLNGSGTGTHSHRNTYFGAGAKVQGILDQGSGSQACGAFYQTGVVTDAETVTNITAANPAVITISGSHLYQDADKIYIYNTGVSAIDDQLHVITRVSSTQFSIPVDGTGWSSGGTSEKRFGNNSEGLWTTNNFKDHTIGYDSFSFFCGGDRVFSAPTAAAGGGALTLRGNFYNYDRGTDQEPASFAQLYVYDAVFHNIGEFNGDGMFENAPSDMKNATFEFCDPIVFGNTAIAFYGPKRYWQDITFTDGWGNSFDLDATNANIEMWATASTSIIIENFTDEGTQHDYYMPLLGPSGAQHFSVTTETAAIPGTGAPAKAQKVSAMSGWYPAFIEQRVYLETGQSVSVAASAYLVDAADVAPAIYVTHESNDFFGTNKSRRSGENSGLLVSDVFHDGTAGSGSWQSSTASYTATSDGWHYVYLMAWFSDDGNTYGAAKVMWGTLTASVSSGGGGGRSRRQLTPNKLGIS